MKGGQGDLHGQNSRSPQSTLSTADPSSTQYAECSMQYVVCSMQGTVCQVQGAECKGQGAGYSR